MGKDSSPRFDDEQDEGSQQQQPVRMLLKKDNMNGQNVKNNAIKSSVSSGTKKDDLTPEIKQAKYDKMKERIFSPQQSPQNVNAESKENDENESMAEMISEHEMLKQSESEKKANEDKKLQIAKEQIVENKEENSQKQQKEGHILK